MAMASVVVRAKRWPLQWRPTGSKRPEVKWLSSASAPPTASAVVGRSRSACSTAGQSTVRACRKISPATTAKKAAANPRVTHGHQACSGQWRQPGGLLLLVLLLVAGDAMASAGPRPGAAGRAGGGVAGAPGRGGVAALRAGWADDVPGRAGVIVGSWWGSQPAHAGNQRIRWYTALLRSRRSPFQWLGAAASICLQ